MTGIFSCDSYNIQLKSITNEQQQEIDEINKIINYKHSANRTSVEHASDCYPDFWSLKAVSKSITKEDSRNIGLKRVV